MSTYQTDIAKVSIIELSKIIVVEAVKKAASMGTEAKHLEDQKKQFIEIGEKIGNLIALINSCDSKTDYIKDGDERVVLIDEIKLPKGCEMFLLPKKVTLVEDNPLVKDILDRDGETVKAGPLPRLSELRDFMAIVGNWVKGSESSEITVGDHRKVVSVVDIAERVIVSGRLHVTSMDVTKLRMPIMLDKDILEYLNTSAYSVEWTFLADELIRKCARALLLKEA